MNAMGPARRPDVTFVCAVCETYNASREHLHRRDDVGGRLALVSTAPKPDPDELNQERFEHLLEWIHSTRNADGRPYDRDAAGCVYEEIRNKLVRWFVCRACSVPEFLSDRTISRAARNLPNIEPGYKG